MSTTTKRRESATERELKMLRNLIVNHRLMDTDFQDLRKEPITESLKHLQQAWMESEWPAVVDRGTRATINEHFWMVFETAQNIERLRQQPHEVKSQLIMTIDGLIVKTRKEEL